MPLNTRPIAVSIAVVSFFGVSFIAWLSGIDQFTCCKRAVVAAAFAYVAATLGVKAVNAILISAMIQSQIKQQEEPDGAAKN